MNLPAHIFFGMVHDLMDKPRMQLIVRNGIVGIDLRPIFHVFQNLVL